MRLVHYEKFSSLTAYNWTFFSGKYEKLGVIRALKAPCSFSIVGVRDCAPPTPPSWWPTCQDHLVIFTSSSPSFWILQLLIEGLLPLQNFFQIIFYGKILFAWSATARNRTKRARKKSAKRTNLGISIDFLKYYWVSRKYFGLWNSFYASVIKLIFCTDSLIGDLKKIWTYKPSVTREKCFFSLNTFVNKASANQSSEYFNYHIFKATIRIVSITVVANEWSYPHNSPGLPWVYLQKRFVEATKSFSPSKFQKFLASWLSISWYIGEITRA